MPIAARSCWIAWAMRGLRVGVHDEELGLEAVGEAGLGEQRLGALRVVGVALVVLGRSPASTAAAAGWRASRGR